MGKIRAALLTVLLALQVSGYALASEDGYGASISSDGALRLERNSQSSQFGISLDYSSSKYDSSSGQSSFSAKTSFPSMGVFFRHYYLVQEKIRSFAEAEINYGKASTDASYTGSVANSTQKDGKMIRNKLGIYGGLEYSIMNSLSIDAKLGIIYNETKTTNNLISGEVVTEKNTNVYFPKASIALHYSW